MSDYFSAVAADYAKSRPTYPPALFAWLAEATPVRDLAWDAGAGSGQASVALSEHFQQVVATDISAEQLKAAPSRANISYHVGEMSDLPDASADLVTVAQALHWFELDTFYAEVRRVLKPGGLLAVWTYNVLTVADQPAINIELNHFYDDIVGPYWPPDRRHVENGYAELAFPFAQIVTPRFAMQAEWSLDQLLGYLKSWSATARMQKATGINPVDDLTGSIRQAWGDPAIARTILWPLTVKAGR